MAGTKAGGLKAAQTNKDIHGADFYQRVGSKGGKVKSPTKGFGTPTHCACDLVEYTHTIAECAGKVGGTISRRKKAVK